MDRPVLWEQFTPLCTITCIGDKHICISPHLTMLLTQVVNRGCIRAVATALRHSLRVASRDCRIPVACSGKHTMGKSDLSIQQGLPVFFVVRHTLLKLSFEKFFTLWKMIYLCIITF